MFRWLVRSWLKRCPLISLGFRLRRVVLAFAQADEGPDNAKGNDCYQDRKCNLLEGKLAQNPFRGISARAEYQGRTDDQVKRACVHHLESLDFHLN